MEILYTPHRHQQTIHALMLYKEPTCFHDDLLHRHDVPPTANALMILLLYTWFQTTKRWYLPAPIQPRNV